MHNDDAAPRPAETSQEKPVPSFMKTKVSGRSLNRMVAILMIGVAAFLSPRLWASWKERAARNSIARHNEPPTAWKGIRLGMSRQEVADMLVDSGVRWISIQKPGTAPTEWAAQTRLTVNGNSAREFSLKFSDGQRWDYARHTLAADQIVDAENLIGALPADSSLNGLMWMIERSNYDLDHETVPVAVLKELGKPHMGDVDITGSGRVYIWDWPALKAYYTTIDGRLSLQSSKSAGTEPNPT